MSVNLTMILIYNNYYDASFNDSSEQTLLLFDFILGLDLLLDLLLSLKCLFLNDFLNSAAFLSELFLSLSLSVLINYADSFGVTFLFDLIFY